MWQHPQEPLSRNKRTFSSWTGSHNSNTGTPGEERRWWVLHWNTGGFLESEGNSSCGQCVCVCDLWGGVKLKHGGSKVFPPPSNLYQVLLLSACMRVRTFLCLAACVQIQTCSCTHSLRLSVHVWSPHARLYLWVWTCKPFCLSCLFNYSKVFFFPWFFSLQWTLLRAPTAWGDSRQAGRDRSDTVASAAALESSIWDMTAETTCLCSWKGHGLCQAVMCEKCCTVVKKDERGRKKQIKNKPIQPNFSSH